MKYAPETGGPGRIWIELVRPEKSHRAPARGRGASSAGCSGPINGFYTDAGTTPCANPLIKVIDMNRIEAKAKVYQGDVYPDDWVVWATDDDGEIITTVFSGSDAEARAMEYAAWRYVSVRRLDPETPPRPRVQLRVVGASQ
jgi:hypothetical protein